MKISETCGGLGALGLGTSYAGYQVTSLNEIQQAFCDQVAQEGRCSVVQGDICKLPTVIQLHETGQGASAYAFGFSCQPFSSLGDNKQGNDDRSATLTYGLYSAYLLQMKIVILECVPNAAKSQFVKQGIQHYINHTDAHRSDVILELSDVWPSFRKRWWCVLSHAAIGKITLQGLPKLDHTPTISDVMPKFMDFTGEKLAQLKLTDYERELFQSLGKGTQQNLVDKHGTLATALHSWGNQCIKCRCGCEREFSYNRLQQEGIHGALVYMANNFPKESLRHLSGQEMALLTGFPREKGWEADQRMLTAGVGQLASSIQSAWIAALIKKHLQETKFIDCEPVNPKGILSQVCLATLDLQQKWMGSTTTVEMDLFREIFETWSTDPPKNVDSTREINKHEDVKDAKVDPIKENTEPPHIEAASMIPIVSTAELVFGQDGFSQEIRQHISQIEQDAAKKGEIKFGVLQCDPTTGGLQAFAVSKVVRSGNQSPQHAEIVQQHTPQIENTKNKDDEAKRFENHVPKKIHQQVFPSEVLQGKLVVFDHDENIFRTIQVDKNQTVGDLVQAERLIHGKTYQVSTCLGRNLNQAEIIDQNIVVLHSSNFEQPKSIVYEELKLQSRQRIESILLQQGAVAADEMSFYLESLATHANMCTCDFLILESLQDFEHRATLWFDKIHASTKPVLTAILNNRHWIPFVWEKHEDGWYVITNPEGENLWTQLGYNHPHQMFVHQGIESIFKHDCGFQSFAWLQSKVDQTDPKGITIQRAEKLRQCYWDRLYLDDKPETPKIILGGHNEELETALGAILREHGVFIERVQDRAKALIQKLGSQAILTAIKSTRPWQSLKQLANEQHPTIRLIQEDEFQRVLNDRTRDGKPVKTQKKESSNKKPKQAILQLTPKRFISLMESSGNRMGQ